MPDDSRSGRPSLPGMKQNLSLAGKSLAGAGLTGNVLYVVGTATQHSWPFWPYWVFTAMLLAGAILYLLAQRRPAAATQGAPAAAASTGSRPGQPFTSLWRHTTNGNEAPNLMMITQKSFSHPGYMRPQSEDIPPSVRIGMIVTCDPLGPEPTTSDLRDNFLSFLRRPPVWNLIKSMTYVGDDLAWRSYAGNGRLNNQAVLTSREDQKEAPVASAMMILNEPGIRRYGHDPQTAELILHIEPRGEDGKPAPPANFQAWHDSLVRTLAVPKAFAQFLGQEVGVTTYNDPAAQIGMQLNTYQSIRELIDCGRLQPVTGSWPSNSFMSYMIADPAGKQATEVAVDWLTRICDHALYLRNGYETELDKLRK